MSTIQIGDIVGYAARRSKVYGIVVGFTHNDYYYIDWFEHGCNSTVPYHASLLLPVEESEEG